jgi:hypothetical protein
MRVAAVMVGARAARAERLAQERGVQLVTTHGEVDEVAFRVSALEGMLRAMRRARDATEVKFLSLAAKAVATERQRVVLGIV